MNILILSPHRDDAAFSLALAMKGWLSAGHRVTILGVFTRSLTAPYSDADTVHPNDLLSYVSAMRRREDAELLKLLPGLHMVDLNLKDALLRLRCTADEVYSTEPSLEDPAVAKIQKALAKLSAERTIDTVLLPLALGRHVDHLVVRDAALGSAIAPSCAFYEDLPDAFRSGKDIDTLVQAELASLRQSSRFAEDASAFILCPGEDEVEAAKTKRRIVSVYASQVDDATIDAITNVPKRYEGGGERVWVHPASLVGLV